MLPLLLLLHSPLWSQSTTDRVPALVDMILQQTHKTANFKLVPAPVATAEATLDGGQRFIRYNPEYLAALEADVLRFSLLAHLIGHHINQHVLTPERQESEGIEAAEFAGYALYHLGAQPALIDALPRLLPQPSPPSLTEQQAALQRGFKRAEAALLLAPYAGFDDDGSGNALQGVAEFPFPPPPASATFDLTDFFIGQPTLGAVADRIKGALDANKYFEKRYYYLNSGFAMVTRIEQFNTDGSSKSIPGRWSAQPVRDETFSWIDYVKSLFTADVGYFRVFVFIVTPEEWVPDRSRRISRQEADDWLTEGASRLPAALADQAVPPRTTVTALVYEFRVAESDRKVTLSTPSELSGRDHVIKAKILAKLK